MFLGFSFPRGNYAGNKSSERQFSSAAISRGILSGGNFPWGQFSRHHLFLCTSIVCMWKSESNPSPLKKLNNWKIVQAPNKENNPTDISSYFAGITTHSYHLKGVSYYFKLFSFIALNFFFLHRPKFLQVSWSKSWNIVVNLKTLRPIKL